MKDTLEVWKFPIISVTDIITIDMPAGAKPLYINEQGGNPCLWALVNPRNPKGPRKFRFAGTGHLIDPKTTGNHIGSFFMHGGALVFHLFEMLGT